MSDILQQKAKLWLLQVFWGDAGQQLPGKRGISSSVCKAAAEFAFAADTLLPGLAGLSAVFQRWLH